MPRRPRVVRQEKLELGEVSFLDLAEHFSSRPDFALLHTQSAADRESTRYSFLSFDPFLVAGSKGPGCWTQSRGGPVHQRTESITAHLEAIVEEFRVAVEPNAHIGPFPCGGIGYFSYEFGRQIERLPDIPATDPALPDCYFCFYQFVITHCHRTDGIYLSFVELEENSNLSWDRLLDELRSVPPGSYRTPAAPSDELEVVSSLPRSRYLAAVNRIRDHITAGDVYQVNLTQRYLLNNVSESPWEIYKRLLHLNPAPFAAFIRFNEGAVICSSPERFLRVRGRQVETRPIKGTIARGVTEAEDAANRSQLLASTKNQAELAMIVDLMRNDLGRVCRPGSIHVKAFPEIEAHPSVHHLVATIEGELEPGRTVMDLIRASFPPGSVTGAPKIRAMEIIAELEPVPRGIYTGAIGYLGFDGNADFNVVIRTIVLRSGRAFLQAGGGIVADSVPEQEYEESLLKASRLFQALCGETP